MDLTTCGRCAALVADVGAHERWREELESAFEQAGRAATSPPGLLRRAS